MFDSLLLQQISCSKSTKLDTIKEVLDVLIDLLVFETNYRTKSINQISTNVTL